MTVFSGEVHWLAAAFPLLDEDALQELAADIESRGLQHPIVLAPDGTLLDGRNRLAACELAGVEPSFTVTELDPVAFITGENAHRRHLSAGQRAMAVAVGMYEAGLWNADKDRLRDKRSQTPEQRQLVASAKSSRVDLASCGQILAHDRALALAVLSGDRQLRETYDEVQEAKRAAAAIERKRSELAEHAPDLLAQVPDVMSVDVAYAAYLERDKKRLARERAAEQARRNLNLDFSGAISTIQTVTFDDEKLASFLDGWAPVGDMDEWDLTVADLTDAIDRLTQIKDAWRKQ